MYIYMYACVCVFRQHFFVGAYLINIICILCLHFYFDPFKLLLVCYDIRLDWLINLPKYFRTPLRPSSVGAYIEKYNTGSYLYWCNIF